MSRGEDFRKDDPAAGWNAERPQRRGRSKDKAKRLKQFCKGKEGVPHKPVITQQSYYRQCRLGDDWRTRLRLSKWVCWHQESCENCGKIIRHFINWRECPSLPADVRAELEAKAQ